MSKKFFIIIGVVLIVTFVALLGYYLFFQQNSDGTTGNITKFKNFFPFGGSGNNGGTETPGTEQPATTTTPTTQETFGQKLRKISSEPVAGAGIIDSKLGTTVRYVEKATGHIFEVELFSPSKKRISNTTIPMVYDATWNKDANALITRYLKEDNQTIDTYSITLKSTTTESTISAVQFPSKITDYSVFGTNIFYLRQESTGSIGVISDFLNGKKKQVWDSPITEFLSQYVNKDTVALQTKPLQNVPGYLYFVNTATGQTRKVLGNIPGMSALASPDTSKVLVLSQTDTALSVFVYDTINKSREDMTPYTFPEKCVWSKKDKNVVYCAVSQEILSGGSLASWYMGLSTFGDNIWKIDVENKTSSIIESPLADLNTEIDVIKPILSDNEQYLLFINKKDSSLWSLDLSK